MFEQLEAFFEHPTAASYRAARRSLLADRPLAEHASHADAAELEALAQAIDQRRLDEALALIDTMLPAWSLSPAFHDLSAQLALLLGDADDAELERFMLSCCLDGMLDTGDGSRQYPYLVSRISDQYDLLAALRLQPRRQRTVAIGSRMHDVVRCDDGSQIHFDITDIVGQTAVPPARQRPIQPFSDRETSVR